MHSAQPRLSRTNDGRVPVRPERYQRSIREIGYSQLHFWIGTEKSPRDYQDASIVRPHKKELFVG